MDCVRTGFNWPSLDAPARDWHIAMWDYLAKHPKADKCAIPFSLVKNKYPKAFATGCFACEEAHRVRQKENPPKHKCLYCPIPPWKANSELGSELFKCLRSDSCYVKWNDSTVHSDTARFAGLVRDAWPKPGLKIEKNRYYMTRGGDLAYVYHTEFINAGGTFPIGGAIRRGARRWYLASWNPQGRYSAGNLIDNEDDLVALVENINWRLAKDQPEYD